MKIASYNSFSEGSQDFSRQVLQRFKTASYNSYSKGINTATAFQFHITGFNHKFSEIIIDTSTCCTYNTFHD